PPPARRTPPRRGGKAPRRLPASRPCAPPRPPWTPRPPPPRRRRRRHPPRTTPSWPPPRPPPRRAGAPPPGPPPARGPAPWRPVSRADARRRKRPVALKVMRPALAASPDFHRRFVREAQLAAALDHEHIVTVYQVSEDRGVPFLAMKLLEGETLEDRLNRSGG